MTITNPDRQRVDVPRLGDDPFWDAVHEHYLDVPDDELTAIESQAGRVRDARWRSLAMLALKENAGWPIETISRAFGRDTGHVSRCLKRATDDLREALGREPSLDPSTQKRSRRRHRDLS